MSKLSNSEPSSDNATIETEVEYEEVEYEELPPAHIIEPLDSVKVKQVFDDSTMEAIQSSGYIVNYYWDNVKLFFMFISCLFALVAQFYPQSFPESRPILGGCCAMYFFLSGVLQYIISFIDKDTILVSVPNENSNCTIRVRTAFARFQEYFTLIIQDIDEGSKNVTTANMYVGCYFTEKGEFDEDRYVADVKTHLKRFEDKKYIVFEYNHKSD